MSSVSTGMLNTPESHPNLPRRGPLALMFAAIMIGGLLGGGIGYGLVNTSCASAPTLAEQLLETVPGFHANTPSCDGKLLAASVVGTVLAAIGAGVVAMLMLRAQSEWRAHPAGRVLAPDYPADIEDFIPPPTGGSPPHT
jgi:hypothetical protein